MDRRLLQQHRPGAEDGRLRREREGRDDATTSRESHGRRQNSVNTNLCVRSVTRRRYIRGEHGRDARRVVRLGFTRFHSPCSRRLFSMARRAKSLYCSRSTTPCPPGTARFKCARNCLLRRVATPSRRVAAPASPPPACCRPPAPGSGRTSPRGTAGTSRRRRSRPPWPSRSSGASRGVRVRAAANTTRRAAGPIGRRRRRGGFRVIEALETRRHVSSRGFSSRRARAVRPSPVHPRNRRRAAPRAPAVRPRAARAAASRCAAEGAASSASSACVTPPTEQRVVAGHAQHAHVQPQQVLADPRAGRAARRAPAR